MLLRLSTLGLQFAEHQGYGQTSGYEFAKGLLELSHRTICGGQGVKVMVTGGGAEI